MIRARSKIGNTQMSASIRIALHDVPQTWLDREKWSRLRGTCNSDLETLTYLNAPFPDETTTASWPIAHSEGGLEIAEKMYRAGRNLLDEFRSGSLKGRFIAIGRDEDSKERIIEPSEWLHLYPHFA